MQYLNVLRQKYTSRTLYGWQMGVRVPSHTPMKSASMTCRKVGKCFRILAFWAATVRAARMSLTEERVARGRPRGAGRHEGGARSRHGADLGNVETAPG